MVCPNNCGNNTLASNADYCSVCGFAISEKAKREQLEKKIALVDAERFKLTAENKRKDDELNLLKYSVVCKVQKIDTLPTSYEIFSEFNNKKREKYDYTPPANKSSQKLRTKIILVGIFFTVAIAFIIIGICIK
jgi:ribosomal protein L37E